MKKSNFVAMILGIISCLFFGLGMCMAMIPEWDAFTPGTVIGCVGIVFALITIFVWRKMEHKEPIKITGKAVLTAVVGIIGAFALGVGTVSYTHLRSNVQYHRTKTLETLRKYMEEHE